MIGDYEMSEMSSSHLKAQSPKEDLTTERQPGRASLGNKGVFYMMFRKSGLNNHCFIL